MYLFIDDIVAFETEKELCFRRSCGVCIKFVKIQSIFLVVESCFCFVLVRYELPHISTTIGMKITDF